MHKNKSTTAALKSFLVAFTYCPWRGSPPSWCHLAEVFKEALDPVSIARQKKKKMNWSVDCHCSSILTPMNFIFYPFLNYKMLLDTGEFSYRYLSSELACYLLKIESVP